MERENTFDANTIGNLAHGKRRIESIIVAFDADALEHLDTLFIPFDDLYMHPYRITGFEPGDINTIILFFKCFQTLHSSLSILARMTKGILLTCSE
jgi:hypothetical protein